VARTRGRAAVAVKRETAGAGARQPDPKPESAPVAATPRFHERSLVMEGHAAAFRIEAGRASATGALPANANENEIAKFLGEAISLAKQMQAVMAEPSAAGDAAEVHILVADPQAGAARQSAIQVSLPSSSNAVVTTQPAGGAGHVVAMLQHFLMR